MGSCVNRTNETKQDHCVYLKFGIKHGPKHGGIRDGGVCSENSDVVHRMATTPSMMKSSEDEEEPNKMMRIKSFARLKQGEG